jgi:hypothetical protein
MRLLLLIAAAVAAAALPACGQDSCSPGATRCTVDPHADWTGAKGKVLLEGCSYGFYDTSPDGQTGFWFPTSCNVDVQNCPGGSQCFQPDPNYTSGTCVCQ